MSTRCATNTINRNPDKGATQRPSSIASMVWWLASSTLSGRPLIKICLSYYAIWTSFESWTSQPLSDIRVAPNFLFEKEYLPGLWTLYSVLLLSSFCYPPAVTMTEEAEFWGNFLLASGKWGCFGIHKPPVCNTQTRDGPSGQYGCSQRHFQKSFDRCRHSQRCAGSEQN